MRKPDEEVKEVVCSETGKPMAKIPLWMADIKVKFVCDEARAKSPSPLPVVEAEPARRGAATAPDLDEIKDVDVPDTLLDEEDADLEAEEEDVSEEEYEA